MTKTQIEELERLECMATAPPWKPLLRDEEHSLAAAMLYTADGQPPAIGTILLNRNAALLSAARNALPRLLEERKRLLEALRRSHDAMATWFSSEYTEHTTALNAKAAIAFAEAPADQVAERPKAH